MTDTWFVHTLRHYNDNRMAYSRSQSMPISKSLNNAQYTYGAVQFPSYANLTAAYASMGLSASQMSESYWYSINENQVNNYCQFIVNNPALTISCNGRCSVIATTGQNYYQNSVIVGQSYPATYYPQASTAMAAPYYPAPATAAVVPASYYPPPVQQVVVQKPSLGQAIVGGLVGITKAIFGGPTYVAAPVYRPPPPPVYVAPVYRPPSPQRYGNYHRPPPPRWNGRR